MYRTLIAAFLLHGFPGYSQVARDCGELTGIILSGSIGGGYAGGVIQARSSAGLVERATTTDPRGWFHIPLLPPGDYQVRVSAAGGMELWNSIVRIRVGESSNLSLQLGQDGAAAFRIDVNASTSLLDPRRTQQSTTIDQALIQSLPINRRNYLEFAALSPGVTDASRLMEQTDLRPPLTPASGLSFLGNNGRGNSFLVDGLSINGASQNVRPSLPQIAVMEFQVSRSSYSSEFGGSTGGVMNIVSRSGGEAWHGSAFGLLRQTSMQSRNYFDPEKSSYARVQSGADVSGPLLRNHTFLYAAVERLDRHEGVFVPILQDSSVLTRLPAPQDALFSFLEGLPVPEFSAVGRGLRAAMTPANNPSVVKLFRANSGVFPFSSKVTQATSRLDSRATEKHNVFARVSVSFEDTQNSQFGALTGYSNGSWTSVQDYTGVLGDTWTLSSRVAGTIRFAGGLSSVQTDPNDAAGPELVIGGFGQFGRNALFPLRQKERHLEFLNTVHVQFNRHALKAGVDVNTIRNNSHISTFFGGRFIFGEAIPLASILESSLPPGTVAGLNRSLSDLGRQDLVQALYSPISSLQSFSLGLPIAFIQGLGNTAYKATRHNHSLFLEDAMEIKRGLSITLGIRAQLDRPNAIEGRNYLAPRFGFAFNPPAIPNTVVRGGYGVFRDWVMSPIPFGQVQINRPDVTLMFLSALGVPGVINRNTGQLLTSIDLYQSLAASGILGNRVISAADLESLGIPPGFRFPTSGGVQKDYTSPYSQQASLQVEHALSGSTTIGMGGEWSRTAHLWRVRDHNVIPIGTRPDGWPLFGRANPLVSNIYVYESAANAFYTGLVLQVNQQLGRRWRLLSHYTLSRALDEVTDFNLEYTPHNQIDARADRGLSPFHQKHRVVIAGIFEAPTRCTGSTLRQIGCGWTLSQYLRVSSARPFNVFSGVDNLGDGQTASHRPLGLGRNTGIGAGFSSLDLRLSRSFAIGRSGRMRFSMDVFNLQNRTNFTAVNSVVGAAPLSALPQPIAARRADPTLPFSYTAALDPRQVQLGLHVEF